VRLSRRPVCLPCGLKREAILQIQRKDAKSVRRVLGEWEEERLLTPEQAGKLSASLDIIPFDWRRLAKYCFWIAIICLVIAFAALLADLKKLFDLLWRRPSLGCLLFAVLAAAAFFFGLRRRARTPDRISATKAFFLLGVLAVATAITFLGLALDMGNKRFSLLFLLAALVYAGLGLWFPSKLVWLFALLSLGSWFGTETGYLSGWGAYWLGMNYPVRFVFFGLGLTGLSYLFKISGTFQDFCKTTYIMGLLYLFIALWIMSIFGNYGDMYRWTKAGKFELFSWSLLFGGAALAVIVLGLKYDDAVSRGFGLTFLFINLYTKFFEYFWDSLHKALFFAILGVSFWLIGSRAERIWLLGQRRLGREDTPAKAMEEG